MQKAVFDEVAGFYDLETEELKRDVPFYIDYAKKTKGLTLELGCGTGRVAIPMTEAGIKVWGVDISKEMLKVAHKKVNRLDKGTQRNIKLIHGDMQNFELEEKFSFIFIAARSFQSLLTKEEQGACLDCVRKHLSQDGIFIVDLFAPKHDYLAKRKMSHYLGKMYDKEHDTVITRRAEAEYNLANQTIKEDWFYEWTDKDGVFHRKIWSFELSYLFRYEAELLLEKHGFEIEDVFGGFDKSPYNYYSGEQIFVTGKR